MRVPCQDVTFLCRVYDATSKQEFEQGKIEINIKHSDTMSGLIENFENFCKAMGFSEELVHGCMIERGEELKDERDRKETESSD